MLNLKNILNLLLLILGSNISGIAQTHFIGKEVENMQRTSLANKFTDFTIVSLDIKSLYNNLQQEKKKTFFRLSLGKNFNEQIELEPNDLRGQGHTIILETKQGQVHRQIHEISTFKGKINGKSDSEVRLLIEEDRIEGYFQINDNSYFIEPVQNFARSGNPSHYILYQPENVIQPSLTCNVTTVSDIVTQASLSNTQQNNICRVLELATEADFTYYQLINDWRKTVNRQLGIINQAEGVLAAVFNISFKISFQHVWTIDDPYKDVYGLGSFRSHWEDNFSEVYYYEFAYLGRAYGQGGQAYVGAICENNTYRYGNGAMHLDNYSNLIITIHEIGHGIGADHDDVYYPETDLCAGSSTTRPVMCPVYRDGSIFSTLNFSDLSKNAINNYLSSVGCLDVSINTNQNLGTQTISNDTEVFTAEQTINHLNDQNFIVETSSVILSAGNNIILRPGFHAKTGTYLQAQILPHLAASNCEGNFTENEDSQRIFLQTDINKDTFPSSSSILVNRTNQSFLKIAPNPFSNTTKLFYTIAEKDWISLQLLDHTGRLIRILLDNNLHYKGVYQIKLSDELVSGVYFIRLITSSQIETIKLMKIQ